MQGKNSYRVSLGPFELVSLGLGGTIGSGIFVVPGIAAGIAGPSSILAWIFASVSATCVMYSLAKTSYKHPSTGAFYSIFSNVFGLKISISLVLLYLISSVFAIATIAAGIGQYISASGFIDSSFVLPIEVVIIMVFCIINIRGIYLSGMLENGLTILKVVPLVALAILLLPFIQDSNFFHVSASSTVGFLSVLVIVYWPFTGFEISAMTVEETKGGQKTVYKSLKIVMGIVVIVYLLLNISLIGSLGSDILADSPAPLATAAGLISNEFKSAIGLIGIIAMLSALNAYMIGTARILQNISSFFGFRLIKDLGSSGTPVVATIVASFSACVMLLFFSNHFEELANIAVVSTLLPYIFVCISAYKIFHNKKTKFIASIGAVSTSIIFAVYFLILLV